MFRVLILLLAVSAALAVLSAPAAAQTACEDDASVMYNGQNSPDNCHVLGGVEDKNNLRVFVADGLIGTQRYDGSRWQRQYYTYGGALVVIDGQKASLGYYHDGPDDPSGGYWGSISTYAAPDSQSRSGDTVTTVWTVEGVQIEQQVTLSSASSRTYQMSWDLTNQRAESTVDVSLLRGADTYLAGNDNGDGFWDGSTNTVGVERTDEVPNQRISYQAQTDPDGYRSAYYDTVISDVESGTLENSVNPNRHDNGYALAWDRSGLAPGETWEVRAGETVRSGDEVRDRTTDSDPAPSISDYEVVAENETLGVSADSGDSGTEGGEITTSFESDDNPVNMEILIEGNNNTTTLTREDVSGDRFEGYRVTHTLNESGTYTVTIQQARTANNDDLLEDTGELTQRVTIEAPDEGDNTTSASGPEGNETATPASADDGTGDGTPTTTSTPTEENTPTSTPTEENTPTTESTPDDGMDGTETSTDGDGPGFGATVALVALLATALLGYRRR